MGVVCFEMEGGGEEEVVRRNFRHSLDHRNSDHYIPSRTDYEENVQCQQFYLNCFLWKTPD